jgi:hypothetical protein
MAKLQLIIADNNFYNLFSEIQQIKSFIFIIGCFRFNVTEVLVNVVIKKSGISKLLSQADCIELSFIQNMIYRNIHKNIYE